MSRRSGVSGLLPGAVPGAWTGVAAVFSVGFWVWVVVIVAHATRFAQVDTGERAAIAALGSALAAASIALASAGRATGPGSRVLARFTASRAPVVGLGVVVAALGASILAPILVAHDPLSIVDPVHTRFLAPSADHWLGTDRLGRDNLARLLYGGRYSLGISVTAVGLSLVVAVAAGLGSAILGRGFDRIVMRLADGLMAFPRQLFVLTLVALFSSSVPSLVLAIAATSWMRVARLVRAEALGVRQTDYVRAAEATGAGRWRVALRHILPNVAGPVVVAATLNVGAVILLEAYLSFLGLGVAPPAPSWGAMVFEAREALQTAWWVALWPALAITTCVLAFNVMGDGLRDALDVRGASGRPARSGRSRARAAAGHATADNRG